MARSVSSSVICVTEKVDFPHVGPVHAFASAPGSAQGQAALLPSDSCTPHHPLSAAIHLVRGFNASMSQRSRRNHHAEEEDSSAGVCRLKAPVASPDRRRPAGTQVSTRTLSATLTSIADL